MAGLFYAPRLHTVTKNVPLSNPKHVLMPKNIIRDCFFMPRGKDASRRAVERLDRSRDILS